MAGLLSLYLAMLAKTNSLLNHILHVRNNKLPNNLTSLKEKENITLFHLTVSMSLWFHLGLLGTGLLLLIESFAYNILTLDYTSCS